MQRISPGDIQAAQNALDFACEAVAEWLVKYKFADWEKQGVPVPDDAKKERARKIAKELSQQSKWFSHGHSIRIPDLEQLGQKIVDFSLDPALNDAVLRYQIMLRITFEHGPVYKVFENSENTISRRFQLPAINPAQLDSIVGQLQGAPSVQIKMACNKCGDENMFQLDFVRQPLQPGSRRFPDSGSVPCKKCSEKISVVDARKDVENQGRNALTPQPKN